MIPAHLSVELDESEVKKFIETKLNEQISEAIFLVDVETMAKKCCMSRRWMEDEILSDPRMRVIEKKKSRKRFYFWEEAKDVIAEIISEW